MTQSKGSPTHTDALDAAESSARKAASGSGAGSPAKQRKPYQRPSVQKRRSVHQATLVSSGGTSGTLTSGGP